MHEHQVAAMAVARQLLKIEAVTLNAAEPYEYASGLLSPIYCDNRLILSYPEVRSSIIDAFLARIEAQALSFDTVAGTATAGIPHAAWIADHLEKPMVYVRGTAKAHGKGRLIEGVVEPGQRVLVVEDLISTAKSALHAVQALREEGAKVHDVLAVFSYGLPQAQAHCREASVACHALSCFEVLLDAAVEQSYLSPNEAESVATWAQDPLAWGKAWREAQA